jgi:hypothetical protein
MEKVIAFPKKEDPIDPHMTGEARCLSCKHIWQAVAPIGATWLECPSCMLMRGRFIYPIEHNEGLRWSCDCGNDLFFVTPDGIYCPNCGEWQSGY